MNERQVWMERIKAVEREYQAAAAGLTLLTLASRAGDRPVTDRLNPHDLQTARENLEDTYLIRLFATFEAGLREAWATAFRRKTKPKTVDLLNGIAAVRGIPSDELDSAHLVRCYRNSIVHEESEAVDTVPLEQARSYLCRFFSRLPLTW